MMRMIVLLALSFNSRTPGGVRRLSPESTTKTFIVSIHAPREGCDWESSLTSSICRCFNSRTPGGVRQDLRQRINGRV